MPGLYDAVVAGKACVVEYEPDADLRDTDLRDTEQVPLLKVGGIEAKHQRHLHPAVLADRPPLAARQPAVTARSL